MRSVFCKDIDIERIINRLHKYDCISFDVFDTLVKRNVKKPSDLYDLIGLCVNEKYGMENFGDIRTAVEMSLYQTEKNVTLDDIYEEIQRRVSNINVQAIKKLEIKYELSYCQCNYSIKKIYDYVKEKGKRVIAISDMYLPQEVVEQILTKCGYDISAIYVSCEYGAQKKEGKLFNIVLRKEHLDKRNVIHIGDSWRADYLGARKSGISSVLIPKNVVLFNTKRYVSQIDQRIKYGVHESVINNNLQKCGSFYEKFGFSILGPTLYSFCRWIESECKKQDIAKIYFFSRDGYIMKKAFDALQINGIESNYLYVSRRALRVPYNASHFEIKDILDLLPNTKQIRMETVFEYLGLKFDDYKTLTDRYGINRNTVVYHHEISEKYMPLLEQLLPDYVNKAKKELKVAINYLKQEGVKGKAAVVDIGWHNSMQFCLESILNDNGIENDLFGLYFGIQSNGFDVNNSKGFITESQGEKAVDSVAAYIGLIESFFLEQKGTVIRYEKSHDNYIPVRDKYEYEENSAEYKAYSDMHKGILKYISVLNKLLGSEKLMLNGQDAYLPIKSFGIQPYLKDVNKFGCFRYFSEGTYYLVGFKGTIYYLLHAKQLKKDLYNARWKIGFLKKLFKIKGPYYKFYMFLKSR